MNGTGNPHSHNLNLLDNNVFISIMSQLREGVTIADAHLPGMPLIYINPAFERITGYSKLDVIDKNCSILQEDDTSKKILDAIRKALKTGADCIVTLKNYKKTTTVFGMS